MRRTLTLFIVGSWLVMMTLLVRKQTPAPSVDSSELPTVGAAERDEWFGVYSNGTKIGHAHRVTTHSEDGFVFYEDSVIALAMLGVPQTLRTSMVAETDGAFALRRFRFMLVSPATVFSAHGTSDGARLQVTYGPEGQPANLTVPLTEPIYLPSTLRPRALAGDRTPGTRYVVRVLNPLTLQHEPLTLTIEGREIITGPDGPVETIRIAEEQQGVRARAWLSESGAVLREEAALGFTLERESPEHARGDAAPAPLDLTFASRIPLTGRIDDPRHAERLVLRVTGAAAGIVPDDPPRQTSGGGLLRISREAPPAPTALPVAGAAADTLAPAPFIESDDPAIVARAHAIVGDSADAAVAARRLVAWVGDNVEKAPSVTVPSARAVLASLRGDCNEHAVLLTALARAVGIPARMVAGAVYVEDAFYYHAWTELWLGRWISADSVFDQMPADATHVKLLEGGPERHAALAPMIGALQFSLADAGATTAVAEPAQ